MLVALLADIHSNLLALESVLADCENRNVEYYVFCGDYVTDGPDADLIVKRIKGLPGVAIRGNREQYMLDYRKNPPANAENPQLCSLVWVFNRLSGDSLDYFETLPHTLRCEIGGLKFNLSHGSPYASRDTVRSDTNDLIIERMAADFDDDVFVMGHAHRQWYREYKGRLFINPGSVGMPTDSHGYKYSILDTDTREVTECVIDYDMDEVEQYYKTYNFSGDNGFWAQLFLATLRTNADQLPRFVAYMHGCAVKHNLPKHGPVPPEIFYEAADSWAKAHF